MQADRNEDLASHRPPRHRRWRQSAGRFRSTLSIALGRALLLCVLVAIRTSHAGAVETIAREAHLALVAEVEAKGLNPEDIVFPDALTDEMKQWLQTNVESGPSPKETIESLLRAMTDADGLGLAYEPGYTGTAEEVFRSRKANCLAFTHLMVGLSRELGIRSYYVNYEMVERFRRSGDLIVVSGHVSAGYGSGLDRYVLDFGAAADLEGGRASSISDLNALARYYANRAAELLGDGEAEESLEWAKTATRLDPSLAEGWSNLGVALRRSGQLEAAEQAYLRASEVDPDYHVAYHNLFALMRLRGDSEAAKELLNLLDRRKNRNPFLYLELGDQSLRQGRLEEAGYFYRRASQLGGKLAETWAARGSWALVGGKLRKAQRWLEKARRIEPEDPRVVDLERQMLELEP
jgi:Flp pilus assembly protein TadD